MSHLPTVLCLLRSEKECENSPRSQYPYALPSVSNAHRLQTPLAVSSFQTWSVGRKLVQPR